MEKLLLSAEECRVLGSLIEKELTTPDYYPLTLNALQNACNQKSNRNPVVDYDDKDIIRVLDSLRSKKLVMMVGKSGSRVPKYQHQCRETLFLPDPQIALLACLLLRGPQTVGELKQRSERMYSFDSIEAVESTLTKMSEDESLPLTIKLPRQPGKRENRYMHLLAGDPEISDEEEFNPMPETARSLVQDEEERWQRLEEKVQKLQEELAALKEELGIGE